MRRAQDIKTANVLLDGLSRAKVCDFGLSRVFSLREKAAPPPLLGRDEAGGGEGLLEPLASKVSSVGVGTLRYLAPETVCFMEKDVKFRFNKACDVYSFGMLLWELTHRSVPFPDQPGEKVATQIAPSGRRPTLLLPAGLEAMGPLITSCWDHDPERRLTMSACTSVLGQLVETAETTEGAERAQRPADRGSGAGPAARHDPTGSPPSIEQAAVNSNTAKIGMDARFVFLPPAPRSA